VTLDSKAKAVEQAGATTIIRRDVGSLLSEQVKAAAPEGVDAVADIVGGPAIDALMPNLRDDGRWVIAGAVAGAIIGSAMHTREHFTAIVRLARDGSLAPLVAQRHRLVEIHVAQDQFVKGDYVGKIAIIP
jgi:NADPH:quinone reductase-like Zn-dependent oxidoreductase